LVFSTGDTDCDSEFAQLHLDKKALARTWGGPGGNGVNTPTLDRAWQQADGRNASKVAYRPEAALGRLFRRGINEKCFFSWDRRGEQARFKGSMGGEVWGSVITENRLPCPKRQRDKKKKQIDLRRVRKVFFFV